MDLSRKINELLYLHQKLVEAHQELREVVKELGQNCAEHDACCAITYALNRAVADAKKAIINSVIGPE